VKTSFVFRSQPTVSSDDARGTERCQLRQHQLPHRILQRHDVGPLFTCFIMARYYYAVTSAVTPISNEVNTLSSALHTHNKPTLPAAGIPKHGTVQNTGPN